LRIQSWEHYGLSPKRMLLLGGAISAVSGALCQLTLSAILGGGAIELSLTIALVVFYIVLSVPKRTLESTMLSQAREATTLAAAASANFAATHSKSRSVLMLDPSEGEVSGILGGVKRRLLLGFSVSDLMTSASEATVSQSAGNVLSAIATSDPGRIDEEGEETTNVSRASELSEESKLPLFMTVAFFSPIMLTLFAVLSHLDGPASLAELVLLQMIVTDIAFYVTSAEKRRLS
jgi:hypothetical protein